jgi:hypothetical protein
MPFNQLTRRDSWPPTILHLADTIDSAMIDENPFAYFLTSPADLDDFDNEDLSAGIESESEPNPIIRSVSPSSLQKRLLKLDEEDALLGNVPMSLREFTQRQEVVDRRSSGRAGPQKVKDSPRRGRGKVRLSPMGTPGRARGSRSLSLRRPHSWREPSPEVWPIAEGHESGSSQEEAHAEQKESKGKGKETQKDADMAEISPAPPSPKPKKTVRWALP